jgi:hypothetical protein
MSELLPRCRDERRRALLRDECRLNGIDYIEVGTDDDGKLALMIFFLCKLPETENPFARENIVIAGGRSVTDLQPIDEVRFERVPEDAYDDYAVVRLNHLGDSSVYTLRLADLADGVPTAEPLPGFDPRYSAAPFTFQAAGPVEIDCARAGVCPQEQLPTPELDYLAKDYASFRRLLLDRLAQTLPGWRERHSPDLYLTLIELLAYAGDQLSYYQDAVMTEAYLETARRRISVRRHVRLIDYRMHEGCNARAWVCLTVAGDPVVRADQIAFQTRPPVASDAVVLLPDQLRNVERASYESFEPLSERRADAITERDLLHPRQLLDRICDTSEEHLEITYLRVSLEKRLPNQEQVSAEALPELVRLLAGLLDELLDDPGLAQTSREALELALIRRGSFNALQGAPLRRHNRRRLEEAFGAEIARPATLSFHEAHNTIFFYTWGQAGCCLPQGSVQATLEDSWEDADCRRRALRYLRAGDVLIFEELIGARTGSPADADPRHRHAVRLTQVEPAVDPLTGQPVVEIAWGQADALPFALCLSTLGPPPECALLERMSVARGNVVLVDHGATVREPDPARLRDGARTIIAVPFEPPFDIVPAAPPAMRCAGEGWLAEMLIGPGRYEPQLARSPLVFSEPLPAQLPAAARTLDQDPRAALPQLELFSPAGQRPRAASVVERLPGDGWRATGSTPYVRWTPRPDLLASGPDDQHFVVEVADDGQAQLRFGDGICGEHAPAGERLLAAYRIGDPLLGNVGAESICRALLRGEIRGGEIRAIRNPLPASGGTAREALDEVRLRAPSAFRSTLRRAITAADYEALVLQPPEGSRARRFAGEIQRARAVIGAPGPDGRAAVRVFIDPRASTSAAPDLLAAVGERLERYRRIGHRLTVELARYVPLRLEIKVRVEPHTPRGQVRAALLERLSSGLLPDGTSGFFHPDRWTFGQGVPLSPIVALARSIPGVVDAQVVKLRRRDQATPALPNSGLLAIDAAEIARLDNDPDVPENGQITLVLEGGR